MKRNYFLISCLLMGTLVSCQDMVKTEGSPSKGVELELNVASEGESRIAYNGYSTVFVTGDKIGVFNGSNNNVSFTVGETATKAASDQSIKMEIGSDVNAYYPYVEGQDPNAVPVFVITAQKQLDADFSHVIESDVLIAQPTVVAKTTKLTFSHVGAWIDFTIYNPESTDLVVENASIFSHGTPFVTAGTVNIMAAVTDDDYLTVSPSEYSQEMIVVPYGDCAVASENNSVVLRLGVLPTDLSNDTLTITINTNQGVIKKHIKGKNIEAGHSYELTYNDKEVYLPRTSVSNYESSFRFSTADLNDENSYFCWKRSKQTKNLIVFWEEGFGDDPSKCTKTVGGVSMKVNVDDMLEKMEQFYACYQDELKFTFPGNSVTDQYKMMIFLFCTNDWIANGGGVDDKIGAFWIAPSACHPVGQTVAHELGHSFQYQVYCDRTYPEHTTTCGYRHSIGTGNAFWEVCAEYQAWQNYALFTDWTAEIPVHQANCHRGFTHEWLRYQCFYLINYWEELHGRDILGKVWRLSVRGEDPIETYKRITSTDQAKFNDEIWVAAAKEMTWSFNDEELNTLMRKLVDRQSATDRKTWFTNKNRLIKNTNGDYYRCYPDTVTMDHGTNANVAFSPQSYGYNAIYLNVPEAGTEVTINFEGLTNYPATPAYNYSSVPGWRWGLVACTGTGGWTPVYSDMKSDNSGVLKFTVPTDTKRLFFVVTGAPTTHYQKLWDNNVTNDYQFPYRFTIDGATVSTSYNKVTSEDITYTYTF